MFCKNAPFRPGVNSDTGDLLTAPWNPVQGAGRGNCWRVFPERFLRSSHLPAGLRGSCSGGVAVHVRGQPLWGGGDFGGWLCSRLFLSSLSETVLGGRVCALRGATSHIPVNEALGSGK